MAGGIGVCLSCKTVFMGDEKKCSVCGKELIQFEIGAEYEAVRDAFSSLVKVGYPLPTKPKTGLGMEVELVDLDGEGLGRLHDWTSKWLGFTEYMRALALSHLRIAEAIEGIVESQVILEPDIQAYANVTDRKARRDIDKRVVEVRRKCEVFRTVYTLLDALVSAYERFLNSVSREISRRTVRF